LASETGGKNKAGDKIHLISKSRTMAIQENFKKNQIQYKTGSIWNLDLKITFFILERQIVCFFFV
jgi:hypothetical protein